MEQFNSSRTKLYRAKTEVHVLFLPDLIDINTITQLAAVNGAPNYILVEMNAEQTVVRLKQHVKRPGLVAWPLGEVQRGLQFAVA